MKKKIVTTILMLCMAFSLVACGNGADKGTDKDTQKENTQNAQQDENKESESESEETGVVYKIKVVDENNNPIGGMMVQLCKDTCMPKLTSAEGVAEFTVAEKSDDYKAGITNLPEGYIYDGEEYVYFEDGATEVTLVIKSAE